MLGRAALGQLVEIGCLGGHGRTGTTLAVIVTLLGQPGLAAVQWVRANYCHDAVETPEQEHYVATFEPPS